MDEAILVMGMAVVTFLIRYPLLGLSGQWVLPPTVVQGLRYVPPAVLTAILVPAVVGHDGDLGWIHPRLWGSLACLGVGLWRRNLLLTIGVGMGTFWLGQYLRIRFGL